MSESDKQTRLVQLVSEVRALGFSFEALSQTAGVSKQAMSGMFIGRKKATRRKGINVVLKYLRDKRLAIYELEGRFERELSELEKTPSDKFGVGNREISDMHRFLKYGAEPLGCQ